MANISKHTQLNIVARAKRGKKRKKKKRKEISRSRGSCERGKKRGQSCAVRYISYRERKFLRDVHRRFDLRPGDIISNIAHDESFCPKRVKDGRFSAPGGKRANFPPRTRGKREENATRDTVEACTRLYSLYCFPITILYRRYHFRRLVLPSSGASEQPCNFHE